MTKFINRGRQTGKSTMMIQTAYITGYPIIVYNNDRKHSLMTLAQDMNCMQVPIYTLREWTEMRGMPRPKFVLIDEALPIIEDLLSATLNSEVLAATLTLPMVEVKGVKEE